MTIELPLDGGFSRMRLIGLLNHCQHFPGFVYEKAQLCSNSGSIEIDMRARRDSNPILSGCHKPGKTYDHLTGRRFEFIPVWGLAVVLFT